MTSEVKVFSGSFAHAPTVESFEMFTGGVGIDKAGKIVFVAKTPEEMIDAVDRYSITETVDWSGEGKVFIPGFVDTHAHAPQYAFTGTAHGVPLLQWLDTYTFPTESKFGSLEFANKIYTSAVNRFIRNGSTTTCWFATIHLPASKLLHDICAEKGQRALIGKVCMDRSAPEYYIEASASASLADTEALLQYCRDADPTGLQVPIITPRFVGTCTGQLMKGLGELARNYDAHVQSHISESKPEVEWTINFHPELETYAGIYDHFGLLTNKTIMAHGCWLEPNEIELLKNRGVSIAHCPNSNLTLGSGLLDARNIMNNGISLGLGTDAAGGFAPIMLDAFRAALHTSSARTHLPTKKEQPDPILTWREAFYLATQGGANSLSMGDVIGSFAVGKEFDALAVNHFAKHSPYDVFEMDTTVGQLEKFLFIGDDRNISHVYVRGRRIAGSE